MTEPVDPTLLTSDEHVLAHTRARAIAYIDAVFDTAEDDLRHGDAAARAAAYRHVLPHLLTLAREGEEEHASAAEEARDAAQRLLDEFKAGIPREKGHSGGS